MKSKLHLELRQLGSPYRARLSITSRSRQTHLYADRFGNFHWVERDHTSREIVLETLSKLLGELKLNETTDRPSSRVFTEYDEP